MTSSGRPVAIERALDDPRASGLSRSNSHAIYAEGLLGTADPFFHDIDAAEDHAREAIQLALGTSNPKSVLALHNGRTILGAVLCRKGEHGKGVELLRPQLEQEADNTHQCQSEYGFYLAMALQHLGQPQAAREQYRKTVEACAKHPPVSRRLRLRDEAAQRLGIDESDGQGPSRDD